MSAVYRQKRNLSAKATMGRGVFKRIRALRERLAVGKGESIKEFINTGRRI
jgi:hypothetical protein